MEKNKSSSVEEKELYTILNRDIVCYPTMKTVLTVGSLEGVKGIKKALDKKEDIFIVHRVDEFATTFSEEDVHPFGVVATVESFCATPYSNEYLLSVICKERAEIKNYSYKNRTIRCVVETSSEAFKSPYEEKMALARLWEFVEKFLKRDDKYVFPMKESLKKSTSFEYVLDYVISHVIDEAGQKLSLLNEPSANDRFALFREMYIRMEASKELEHELYEGSLYLAHSEERKYLLKAKLKLIQAELNSNAENHEVNDENVEVDFDEDENYVGMIMRKDLPTQVREKLLKEARKLSKMHFASPEANVITSYLDICLELPWMESTEDTLDINKAIKILDKDHYGLKKVKERVIEHLSVKLLSEKLGGQILCLVGAPGVGKTSVASSVARAMGKKFARVSLGGIRDESDIRGHRKTYIGSMPGRIINAIKNAGVNNPLILLDEIDKMSSDFRGDPASALLEVLDSEQNCAFRDHYIEIPFDLSDCFFIATANTLSTVPKPLLDRMEIIELESYTDIEKLEIAKRHLIPKQLKKHGLNKTLVSFTSGAINRLIEEYTREAGVRNLEREIASVCRKCAKIIIDGEKEKIKVTDKSVEELLGPPQITLELIAEKDAVGCVNGLAWTSVGGEVMKIEVVSMNGSGKLELTGSLGDVMKESAMAALSFIRKHSSELGVEADFHSKKDIHIHVPEGAVPKDGPSAGIALTTAIISELTGRKVRRDVAMTGEITLTGRVLPIGGLKEKTMGAYKAGVKRVILPKDNEKDILKLDDLIKEKLEFKYVSDYMEILPLAFAD